MITWPKKCICGEEGFVDMSESQTIFGFIKYPCKVHYQQINEAILEIQTEINKGVPLEYGVEIT